MTEANLSAEQKLAIKKEVESSLQKIASVFGVANIAVLFGAIWFMWTTFSGQVAENTLSVKTDLLENIRTSQTELNEAVGKANRLIGRLQVTEGNIDEVDNQISSMGKQISQFQDVKKLEEASKFLDSWDQAENMKEYQENVNELIKGFGNLKNCDKIRIVSGRTDPKKTKWTKYKEYNSGAFVVIDTKEAGFTITPHYFSSIGGNGGHWSAVGPAGIYGPSASEFKTYVQWRDSATTESIKDYAINAKWHVNWMAIGC